MDTDRKKDLKVKHKKNRRKNEKKEKMEATNTDLKLDNMCNQTSRLTDGNGSESGSSTDSEDLVNAINYNTITSLAALKDIIQGDNNDTPETDSFFQHYFMNHCNNLSSRNIPPNSPFPYTERRRLSQCREEDEEDDKRENDPPAPILFSEIELGKPHQSISDILAKELSLSDGSEVKRSNAEKDKSPDDLYDNEDDHARLNRTIMGAKHKFLVTTTEPPLASVERALRSHIHNAHTVHFGTKGAEEQRPSMRSIFTGQNLHRDKNYFDSSLIEIRSTVDEIPTSSEDIWVKRTEDKTDAALIKQTIIQDTPASITNNDTEKQNEKPETNETEMRDSKTSDKSTESVRSRSGTWSFRMTPKEKDALNKIQYRREKDLRRSSDERRQKRDNRLDAAITRSSQSVGERKRRGSNDDGQPHPMYQQTIHGTSGVSRRPALFDIFKSKPKTGDAKKQSSIMQQVKAAVQSITKSSGGSSTKEVKQEPSKPEASTSSTTPVVKVRDGSAHKHAGSDTRYYHTLTASSSRRPSAMAKVMEMFRGRSSVPGQAPPTDAAEKRKARALAQQQHYATAVRPLWVRLQGGKRPLVAGQSTELVCQAVGARPKPTISWWRGGTRLKTVRETTSTDGNVTSSVLTFVPSIEDAGRVLSCRAIQPTLPHSTHEDGWKMEIQHLPVVKLELGANLDASKVVEGSDIYLDCRVRANPWHNHVYFTHNGVIVKSGPGVLLANQSLVLQKVSRKAAGSYVCSARNSLGDGSSEPLMLDVKFSPTCRSNQPLVLRAARGEVVEIECDLDANPQDSIRYHWWFNSSAHSKHELSTTAMTTAQNLPGTYLYMVNTSSDYGWVQCSGSNMVGGQAKPCLFHILPADKPSAPKACEITNVTYDSLTLNCTPGHDGGLRQYFLLQIFDMATGLLLRNMTGEEPEFEVSGLPAGNALGVAIKAFNRKGSSEPLSLSSNLLKYPQRHTAQVPVKVELTTVLIIVLAAVGLIAAMTALSAAVFCCRYCQKKEGKSEKDKRQQDETLNIPLTSTKESESVDSIDKNPDIIPLDGKISDSCSNKSSTTDYSSIRPLISKTPDKYDLQTSCDRFYDHNLDQCNQYIQVRPIDYRRPTYAPTLAPMPNLGPSIQSLGPMSSLHLSNVGPNDCHRQYDKVYEDWLKYKNALPLNTTGLLPAEQLMPPELYATPPPTIYSNSSRNPLNLTQMPDLEPRYHLEPRSLMTQDSRSCSNSPPVRFNTDNTVYYSKGVDRTNTLPHLKSRINVNSPVQTPCDNKTSSTKSPETNLEHLKLTTKD